MMKYKVYVLRSEKDGRLYKGMAIDLARRIREHNRGKTRSTKAYKPWTMVYEEEFDSREEARNREKYLKSGEGREFLKDILDL